MRSILSLAALAALTLAPACTSPSPAVRGEEIVRGTRETGYPEVVAVYWSTSSTSGGLCSGTVIGPYAILTAKHCVFEELAGGAHRAVEPRDFIVIVGNDINDMASGIESTHGVVEVRTTPGTDVSSDVENGNDIAILLLASAIDITPRGTATSGPSSGDDITIVGFGRTSSSSDAAGVKYRGTTEVQRTGMRLFETDGASWTCSGDSGGPAIDPSGNVTGITSFGFGDCRLPYSYFTRVAAHRALITDALTFVPPCAPRPETCNDIDDDCDGEADDGLGCAELGEPCTTRDDCVRAACEEVAGAMICVRQCFPDTPGGCPTDQHCEPTGCGIGRCIAGAPGAATDGTVCTGDLDCASGFCGMLDGTMRCMTQCQPDAAVCPEGEVCEPTADDCGGCVPMEISTRPRGFGEACGADEMCESGDCGDEGFCTHACATHAECGATYHCESSVCMRGDPAAMGSACTRTDECVEGLVCEAGACATVTAPMGGGCAAGGRGSVGAWALALWALIAARRRGRERLRGARGGGSPLASGGKHSLRYA